MFRNYINNNFLANSYNGAYVRENGKKSSLLVLPKVLRIDGERRFTSNGFCEEEYTKKSYLTNSAGKEISIIVTITSFHIFIKIDSKFVEYFNDGCLVMLEKLKTIDVGSVIGSLNICSVVIKDFKNESYVPRNNTFTFIKSLANLCKVEVFKYSEKCMIYNTKEYLKPGEDILNSIRNFNFERDDWNDISNDKAFFFFGCDINIEKFFNFVGNSVNLFIKPNFSEIRIGSIFNYQYSCLFFEEYPILRMDENGQLPLFDNHHIADYKEDFGSYNFVSKEYPILLKPNGMSACNFEIIAKCLIAEDYHISVSKVFSIGIIPISAFRKLYPNCEKHSFGQHWKEYMMSGPSTVMVLKSNGPLDVVRNAMLKARSLSNIIWTSNIVHSAENQKELDLFYEVIKESYLPNYNFIDFSSQNTI